MKLYTSLLSIVLLATPSISFAQSSEIDSNVVTTKTAETKSFDWGSLTTYYSGETAGTKDMLSAMAIIKPGMEIHPAHKHSEEEYLMILEGSGTWTLHDKDFEAKAGDMLFSKPWDLHGLKNTGKTPLKFIVFKWNNKRLK